MPSRLEEGHGLSLAALDAAERGGATVIVTVDCGSTSHAEIAAANDARHRRHRHRPPSRAGGAARPPSPWSTRIAPMPRIRTVVSPGAGWPSRSPRRSSPAPGGPAAALDLVDLATIGTVADVAPIVGENRAIARLGIERIRRAPRPGIAALLARARIDPAAADLETISFAIAPRLNAAGRVGEAVEAARLLLAEDAGRPRSSTPTRWRPRTSTRRDLLKRSLVEAQAVVGGVGRSGVPRARPSSAAPGTSASSGSSRLAWPTSTAGPPSSVRRSGTRSGPRAAATDRSTSAATLERCADLFTRFGGHAGAAGFELAGGSLGRLPRALPRLSPTSAPRATRGCRSPSTWRCPPSTSTTRCWRELASLAPAGPGNPEPLLVVTRPDRHPCPRRRPAGTASSTLRRDLDVLDGIAFGRPDLAETVHEGDRLDVVARLVSRRFGGLETLQLEIRDAATAGLHDGGIVGAVPPEPLMAGTGLMAAQAPARAPSAERRRGPPRAGDPYGIGPVGSLIAPIASVIGLLLVAVVTINLFSFQIRSSPGTPTRAPAAASTGRPCRPRRRTWSSSRPRPRSRDPSSTPRPATSGSRTPMARARSPRVAATRCRRGRRTASTCTTSETRDAETNWRGDALPPAHPGPDARARRRQRRSGTPDDGPLQERQRDWAYWLRQPTPSPDGEKIALITDSPESRAEQRRPAAVRHRHEEDQVPRARARSGSSGTRTRSGARTASTCCTSRTAGRARGARRSSRATTRPRRRRRRSRRRATPRPSYSPDGRYIAVTRTNVLRHGRGHPRREQRTRGPARHRRRRVVQPVVVAGGRRRSRSSTWSARSSTCTWPSSTSRAACRRVTRDDPAHRGRRASTPGRAPTGSSPPASCPPRPRRRRRPPSRATPAPTPAP